MSSRRQFVEEHEDREYSQHGETKFSMFNGGKVGEWKWKTFSVESEERSYWLWRPFHYPEMEVMVRSRLILTLGSRIRSYLLSLWKDGTHKMVMVLCFSEIPVMVSDRSTWVKTKHRDPVSNLTMNLHTVFPGWLSFIFKCRNTGWNRANDSRRNGGGGRKWTKKLSERKNGTFLWIKKRGLLLVKKGTRHAPDSDEGRSGDFLFTGGANLTCWQLLLPGVSRMSKAWHS